MPKTHRVDRDVKEFCGWARLMEIINRGKLRRDRALMATIFLTGGRISEVLLLRKSNFDVSSPDLILVKSMRILKRYEKISERIIDGRKRWTTKLTEDYRSFPIMRKEPATPILEDWLVRIKRTNQHLFSITRVQAFLIIRGLGKDLYPHWFRAQRACQLAFEYGFDLHDLLDFFGWKDIKIALHYSKLGWKGLAKKMGGQV